MSSDIRVNVSFLSHHKVVKIRKRLGDSAALSLIALWCFAAQNRTDGILTGMDDEDVEIAAQWYGENGALVKELLSLKLIDRIEGTYCIHDWFENNPWVADAGNRSAKAKKAATSRWEREIQENQGKEPILDDACSIQNDACSIQGGMLEHDFSNAPFPPPPFLTKTLTTEEERTREPMLLSEVKKLYTENIGKVPQSQPIVSTLIGLCQAYPPDRLRIAFQAVAAADKPNLNWVRTYLDNPQNWDKTYRKRGSPRTFEQIKLDNTKQAMVDFVEGAPDAGHKREQDQVCLTHG